MECQRFYASIPAIRYNRRTGEGQKIQLHWLIEEHFGKKALVFLNGSTGYEAFFVENILTWPQQSDQVAICAGCDNYDRIVCSHKDMVEICQTALDHLNYRY